MSDDVANDNTAAAVIDTLVEIEPVGDLPNDDHPLKWLEAEALVVFDGAEADVKAIIAWVASKL